MMPAGEYKVHLIALVCFFFCFFSNSRIAVRAWKRAATGQGGVVRRSKVMYTPGSLLARLLHERWHVGKTRGQLPSLHSAEPRQKPMPSSPNGLRLSGVFLLLLSPLESASQSGYINPGSRTWGLVRDTARLEETQRMFLGWRKKQKFNNRQKKKSQRTPSSDKSTSPLWCHNSHQNLCSVSRSIVFV